MMMMLFLDVKRHKQKRYVKHENGYISTAGDHSSSRASKQSSAQLGLYHMQDNQHLYRSWIYSLAIATKFLIQPCRHVVGLTLSVVAAHQRNRPGRIDSFRS